jgi:diguanylate cyclase (GGDEF)-like protein/PAS domain S-box-containing protein
VTNAATLSSEPTPVDDAAFRQIIEQSELGIILFDERWKPLFVNLAYVKLFGFESATELLALGSIETLIAPADRERLRTYRTARLDGRPAPTRYDFVGVRKDASRLTLNAIISTITWATGTVICTTVSDVTVVRRVASDDAARQGRRAAAHQALLDVATFEGESAGLIGMAMSTASTALNIARCGVWRLDATLSVAQLVTRYDAIDGTFSSGNQLACADYPEFFGALEAGRSIAADQAASHSATQPFGGGYLEKHDIQSVIAAPLRFNGQVGGFVSCEHIGQWRHWNTDEQAFLASLAGLISQSMERHGRQAADQRALQLERRYRQLFQAAPIALLEEDWSEVRTRLAALGEGCLRTGLARYGCEPEKLAALAAIPRLVNINDTALALLGATDVAQCREHLRRTSLTMHGASFVDRLSALLNGALSFEARTSMELIDGDTADVRIRLEVPPQAAADWSRVYVSIEDTTEQEALAKALAWQLSHDPLTGLVNRREFENRLARLVSTLSADKQNHVLAFIGLDQFHLINDSGGHMAGDRIIADIGVELLRTVRPKSIVARLGGDEFAVLMPHCSLDQGIEAAESIRQAISDHRLNHETQGFGLTATVGLVHITAQADIHRLLADADAACQLGKKAGRNRVHVYAARDDEIVARREHAHWLARVQSALDANDFVLVGQPVVALRQDPRHNEKRYEVLLRMRYNDKLTSPNLFMPAAERYGLASQLDRWVIRTTLELASTHDLGDKTVLSVNLSGHSLGDENFLHYLRDAVSSSGVNGRNLCFEITESAAITNVKVAMRLIAELRELGCCFALDDFGRGLSSFAYLKTLPVDIVKIDGLFVRGMAHDELDFSMVKTINEVAHTAGMMTVAEYVENQTILDMLTKIGVDYGQGFAMGPSLPLETILGDLARSR